MALEVIDADSVTQNLPQWVDNVYRFTTSITPTQMGADDKDFFLLTGSSTGVSRVLWCRITVVEGGTTANSGVYTLQRVTVAPTGQTNVAVTGNPHDPSAAAAGTAGDITPSSSQTKGTAAVALASAAVGGSTTASVVNTYDLLCGPNGEQQPIIIGQGKFITLHASKALVASSALTIDIGVSEATT